MKNPKFSAGFTLVELMVGLAVGAIVVTQSVSGLSTMVKNNRMTTQANQFVVAINLARSEAVKRGVNIDVIATNSNDTSNEWGSGWRVQVNGGAVLREFPALHANSALNSTNDIDTIQYQASGRANITDTLELCDDRVDERGRQITISTTGRVSTSDLVCP